MTMKLCVVSDCERPSKTRGMCGLHAERVRAGSPIEGPPRWSRVDFDSSYAVDDLTDCWIWQGAVSTSGYGRINKRYAHRMAYERAVGPIPPGLQIDHLCRVRLCVNPDHLEAVTQRENILRSDAAWGRVCRTGTCKRGHPYTEENTYRSPSTGGLSCRECTRMRRRGDLPVSGRSS